MSTPYHALGLRVAKYRLSKGWTQTELAFHMGTSQGRVSQIENGKERPTLPQALYLSAEAGIAAHHWDHIDRAIAEREAAQ